MDRIAIAITGIAGIIFTFWFFLMKREKIVEVENNVNINVKGGYNPSVISIPKGKTTTIDFLRTDESSCLEDVILSDFKIKKHLPLNQKVSVSITPKKEGEYQFVCGMNMFHGKIIVK